MRELPPPVGARGPAQAPRPRHSERKSAVVGTILGTVPTTWVDPSTIEECHAVWNACMKRIRRWRVPPRWYPSDWIEEMDSEGKLALVEALLRFDPEYGTTLPKYVEFRIISRTIARYRKEWRYALHFIPIEIQESWRQMTADFGEPDREMDLEWAMKQLTGLDREILKGIYWRGATEANIADALGYSQQWISVRKRAAIDQLYRLM